MELEVKSRKEFYDIYNKYYYKVYGLCLKVLNNNKEEALDATQETFVQVFKSIDTLRDESKLNFWINKIAISKCSYIINKNKKYSQYVCQDIVNKEADNLTPEIVACTNEKNKSILEAINKLSYKKRIVILLYYYNNLKIEEIAEMLKIPVGTVKSRMNSAKKDLRKDIEKNKLYSVTFPLLLLFLKYDPNFSKEDKDIVLNNINSNFNINLRKDIEKNKLYSVTFPLLLLFLKYDPNFSKEDKDIVLNNINSNFNINNNTKLDGSDQKVFLYKYLIGVGAICVVLPLTNKLIKVKKVDHKSEIIERWDSSTNKISSEAIPELVGVDDITILKGEEFDLREGVYVKDEKNVIEVAYVKGFVDVNLSGEYVVEYILQLKDKKEIIKKRKITVK